MKITAWGCTLLIFIAIFWCSWVARYDVSTHYNGKVIYSVDRWKGEVKVYAPNDYYKLMSILKSGQDNNDLGTLDLTK